MAYTIKRIAKLSGTSIRTLRYYDEIGLLKPAYYGENNYRYYENEQLLILQQILFYREIDFFLDDIKRILHCDSFNMINALTEHRGVLEQRLHQTQQLIETIDITINYLRVKISMKDEELYYGFDSEQQKQYEKELVRDGVMSQNELNDYQRQINHWSNDDKERYIQEGKQISQDLILAITNQQQPSSAEVQQIIRRHHAWVGWNPTKEKYIALTEMYKTPEFKMFYDKQHADLLWFITEGMKFFAEKELH